MQNLQQPEEYKKSKASSLPEEPGMDQEIAPEDLGDGTDATDTSAPTDGVPGENDFLPEPELALPAPAPAPLPMDNGGKPYMVITNLKKIADQANQLVGMITSGMVEPWAADHITPSADDIEEVYNYYKYKD